MKRKLKRACCALLSTTTLVSSLTFLPVNALSSNQDSTEQVKTDYGSTEIPEGMGVTGDLSLEKEPSDDVTIIKSVDDYYKELENNDLSVIGNVKRKKSGALPSSVDNSQSKYFPSIGDQGSLGACVAFAQVYYQFTYTYNKAMDIETTAENTFSPKFVYNFADVGDNSGSIYSDAYSFMQRQGNVPLGILPYDDNYSTLNPSEEIWATSIKYRLKDYQVFEEIGIKNTTEDTQITSPNDSDLQAIKASLSNGDVLTFSTYAYSFKTDTIKANSAAPENTKFEGEQIVSSLPATQGSHRMALVGYNDNIWCDVNNNGTVDNGEMGAFKIANSWNESYGNNGFIWVAYDALNEVSSVRNFKDDSYKVGDL